MGRGRDSDGEAKCLLFPSQPLEYHNYFKTLEGAAGQDRRKVGVARRSKAELIDVLGLRGDVDESDVTFLPFVLVNQPFGAGRPVDRVPVVDLILLNRFLHDGVWEGMVVRDEIEGYRTAETFKLCDGEEDAAAKIVSYMYSPLQLKHYWEGVQPRLHRHPMTNPHATKELAVFSGFFRASDLPVVDGSVEKRPPPEPDVLCEVAGEGPVAFELLELIDEKRVARPLGIQF